MVCCAAWASSAILPITRALLSYLTAFGVLYLADGNAAAALKGLRHTRAHVAARHALITPENHVNSAVPGITGATSTDGDV